MVLLTTPELSRIPDVRHGFTTRDGGVSVGPRASLNLAMSPSASPDSVAENWRRVLQSLDPGFAPADLALASQVHGNEVLAISTGKGPLQVVGEGDALITTAVGVVLAIRTADCVPVLLAGPRGVGAAHAGWRGVAAGIVGRTVAAMCTQQGCTENEITAAVGPHISVEAYEVGPEVVAGIVGSGVPASVFVQQRARAHVDLRAAVAWQLQSAGVLTVGHCSRCTFSDPALFSYRGDGPDTGRLAAVIGRVS